MPQPSFRRWRISALRNGSKSISNQGLRFSQPMLRHDGCGSGRTFGLPGAAKMAPPVRDRLGQRSRARCAQMPGLRIEADGQHQLDLRHQRQQPAPARPARIRAAAAGRRLWRPGRESRSPSARWRTVGVVELVAADAEPIAQPVAGGIVERACPMACTLVPGAWPAISIRGASTKAPAPAAARAAAAGRAGLSRQIRQARISAVSRSNSPTSSNCSGGCARARLQRRVPAKHVGRTRPGRRCAPAS